MADEKKEGEAKKTKLPTAQKRRKQDDRRQLRNRVRKSQVQTARVAFAKAPDANAKETKLKQLYSLLDKAVKKGFMKPNKASRLKSRLAAKV